jgi:hypothetical protein
MVSRRGKRQSKSRQAAASKGADLVAGTAGAAAAVGGGLALPPFGSLIGPAVTAGTRKLLHQLGVDRAFATAAEEFAARSLGPRQQERIRLTYETAAQGIVDLIQNGPGVRDDGFFTQQREDGSSAADETLEHLLSVAQEDYDRRKARALGLLLTFIARRPDIRPAHANRLIELAGRLTYQQLLWLGLFHVTEDPSRLPDWSSSGMFNSHETQFVGEVGELAALDLVKRRDNARITDFGQLNPSQLQTVLDGKLLAKGMGLHEAEKEDADALSEVLSHLGVIDAEKGRTPVDAIGLPGTEPGSRIRLNYRVVELPSPRPLVRSPESEALSPSGEEPGPGELDIVVEPPEQINSDDQSSL